MNNFIHSDYGPMVNMDLVTVIRAEQKKGTNKKGCDVTVYFIVFENKGTKHGGVVKSIRWWFEKEKSRDAMLKQIREMYSTKLTV